jgi:hypothetical protein
VHIDIKHLPKLQTANGDRRKRYLYVAIDRRSRSVTSPSRTTRPSRAPSPSCVKLRQPFLFV